MSHSTAKSITAYISPSVQGALQALESMLVDYHYSAHCVGRIVAYAAANGTLAGCIELDREDEPAAEMAFVDALYEVPADSPAWDREDVFLDVELLAAGTHPTPFDPDEGCAPVPDEIVESFTPVSDDDPFGTFNIPDPAETGEHPTLTPDPDDYDPTPDQNWLGRIMPIRGGSPEEYIPTFEDLQEYGEWSAQLEATRAWYDRHSVAEFNASV